MFARSQSFLIALTMSRSGLSSLTLWWLRADSLPPECLHPSVAYTPTFSVTPCAHSHVCAAVSKVLLHHWKGERVLGGISPHSTCHSLLS